MGVQNQNMNLVLSTDAKPRLKWTAELHQRFLQAVSQLGGPDKATPKSLMRAMAVPGLTLYHLKSHLQKHRLGKSLIPERCNDHKQEADLYADDSEVQSQDTNLNQNNESLHITQAWRMQIEVQRKLQEQIEVQRHLQLRIEAQGKYLQSVLKKAQETLAGYNSSSVGVEQAKSELSHLVSMVSSGCQSSSLTAQLRSTICSMESSLTSSESSGHKAIENEDTHKTNRLLKRSADMISNDHCVEQLQDKRSSSHREKNGNHEWSGMLDLNRQYENDVDSGPETIDLNTRE